MKDTRKPAQLRSTSKLATSQAIEKTRTKFPKPVWRKLYYFLIYLLFNGKPRRDDVRWILLVVQNDGVGPDVLEQQRLDEVHAKSICARQAMRRDILRDVRVPTTATSHASSGMVNSVDA